MGGTSFSEVLRQYEASHNEHGTDKTTSHSYGALYSGLFEPLRDRARRVLEIGVYSGASVTALADYFAGAQALGVDVTLERVTFGLQHPRVRYVRGDATLPGTAAAARAAWPCPGSAGVLERARVQAEDEAEAEAPPFDLVLDDGSHRLGDQAAALRAFAPHLAPGTGLYVIEDIADVGHRAALEAAGREASPPLELVGWHDLRHVKRQFDDVVAVFRVGGSAPQAPPSGLRKP